MLFGHIGVSLLIAFILVRVIPKSKKYVNYWFILLGSILPDLIDKPIGRVFFAESIANGRIYAHTLLFALILTMVSIYLFKYYKNSNMLCVSSAVFLHICEDGIWNDTQTLFWPFYGWNFPRKVIYGYWLNYLLHDIFNNPYLLISEIIGIITIFFAIMRAKKIK